MNNNHKTEKGQAIAEFVISLIAILVVLCSVIIVGQLGRGSLKNLLEARKEVDRLAGEGVFGAPQGEPIADIQSGSDGLYFTSDDSETLGTAHFTRSVDAEGYVYSFRDEVYINEADKYGELSLWPSPVTLKNNFPVTFFISPKLFLEAADLTKGSRSALLPDSEYEIVSPQMLEFLVGSETISVSDDVYMPRIPAFD